MDVLYIFRCVVVDVHGCTPVFDAGGSTCTSCKNTCSRLHTHQCMSVHIWTCTIDTHMYVYTYNVQCTHVRMCMHVYVYTYVGIVSIDRLLQNICRSPSREKETERERERQKQRERMTHIHAKQKERERDRGREREIYIYIYRDRQKDR